MKKTHKKSIVRKPCKKLISLMLALAMVLSLLPTAALAEDSGESQTSAVTSISLNKTSTVIDISGSETLEATISPEDPGNTGVTWTSSDEAVATVDASGKVMAVAAGTATIKATSLDGGLEASCQVTVPGIALSYTEKTVKVSSGNFDPPTVTTYPSDQTVSWAVTSGASSLTYKVNRAGTAFFQAGSTPGTGIATASMTYNSKKYTADVTVTVEPNYVTDITIAPASTEVYIGGSVSYTASISPLNASVKTLNWSSADTAIATVDSTGKVTGVSSGTTTISATSTDGSQIVGSASITVKAIPQVAVVNDFYEIYTGDELDYVAAIFSAGTQSVNNVKLMDNIDMTAYSAFAGFGGTFSGTFDGNGKTVTVALVGDCDKFGFIHALGDGAVVKDLTLAGSVSNTMAYTAGIVGAISGVNASMINCTNNATVVGSYSYGKQGYAGIVGYIYSSKDVTVTIQNCTNNGQINNTGANTAGIVGYVSLNTSSPYGTKIIIEKCFNKGAINGTKTSSQTAFGGIVGKIYYNHNKNKDPMFYIKECINYAPITSANETTSSSSAGNSFGGIVGLLEGTNGGNMVTIMNCANKAEIDAAGNRFVGGIVGCAKGTCANIVNCYNSALVSCNIETAGSLVGSNQLYAVNMVNCYTLEYTTAINNSVSSASYDDSYQLKSQDYMKTADFLEELSGSGIYRSRAFVMNTSGDMLPEIRTEDTATVTDIEINTLPAKTDYVEGDEIDITGIVVYEKYDDGTSKAIPMDELTVSAQTATLDMTEYTVAYGEFSKPVSIRVKNTVIEINPDETDNTIGQEICLTFEDDPEWREAITGIEIDETLLESDQYQISEGIITLDQSLFTVAKEYEIIVLASGYKQASLKQVLLNAEGKLDGIITINDKLTKAYDGNAVTAPTDFTKNSDGAVTVTFYDGNTDEEISAPSAVGSYYVKAYMEATQTHSAGEVRKDFSIVKGTKQSITLAKTVYKDTKYSISYKDYIIEGGSLGSPVFNQQKAFADTPRIDEATGTSLDFTIAADTQGKNSPSITVTVNGGENYNNYNITLALTILDKPAFPYESLTVEYGNTNHSNAKNKILNLPEDASVTFESDNPSLLRVGADGGITGNALGSATITATIRQASTDTEIQISYPVTIEKRTVSIHVRRDYVRYVGGIAPQLDPVYNGKQYTVFGLVNGAELKGNLQLSFQKDGETVVPDMNTAGTYDIVASGAMVPDPELYKSEILYYSGKLEICDFPTVEKTETIEISTPAEYRDFVTKVGADPNHYADKVVQLTDDIDLTGVTVSTIQYYAGTFDGQYHKISGLSKALFRNITETGIIENLVVDGKIVGTDVTVGVAPIAVKNAGQILNCGNLATVSAPLAAGIVWSCDQHARVIGCFNRGTINGPRRSAAIVFLIDSCAIVKNCYNSGTVTSGEVVTLIGIAYPAAEVINCYNNATLIANVGDLDPEYPQSPLDSPVYAYNCYATDDLFVLKGNLKDESTCAQLTALNVQSDFAGFDFENEWVMTENGPVLKWFYKDNQCLVCGHDWIDATCTTIKTCAVCGITEGDPLGHSLNKDNTKCTLCGKRFALDAPNVTVKRVNGKAKLTWSKVTGASKYGVYRATSKNGSYKKLTTTASLSYTNTSASAGKTYYYKVKAISDASSVADSAYSTIKSFTTTCAKPVLKLALSNKKPKLTWNAITGASKYQVYRATKKKGSYTRLATTTNRSYVDKKAVKGKTYYYKVKALNKTTSYANSSYSLIKSITSK